MDTWAFFHLLAVVNHCWLYKDLFELKQGMFKSNAVNPLSSAGLTLPVCLAWVPVLSLTLSLSCTPRPLSQPSTLFPALLIPLLPQGWHSLD